MLNKLIELMNLLEEKDFSIYKNAKDTRKVLKDIMVEAFKVRKEIVEFNKNSHGKEKVVVNVKETIEKIEKTDDDDFFEKQ